MEDIGEGQGVREGEAGAVKRALIGHLLCSDDSSRHWGEVGGEGGQHISGAWWETRGWREEMQREGTERR